MGNARLIVIFMNRRLVAGLGLLLGGLGLWAQTNAPFVNNSDFDMSAVGGPRYAPQVDSPVFINSALFNILAYDERPFATKNTLFYTNKASGDMRTDGRFLFDYDANTSEITQFRYPAWQFHNQGKIYGEVAVEVRATNIYNPGVVGVGPSGLLRLVGEDVNLARATLRAGVNPDIPSFIGGDGRDLGGTYENARGVTDVYWGTGTNSNLGTNGARLNLPFASFINFDPPGVSSPNHQVLEWSRFLGNRLVTNNVSLPGFFSFSQFEAHARQGTLSPTSSILQVVFVATNNASAAIPVTKQVRFDGGFFGEATPIVEFSVTTFDVIRQTNVAHTLYLLDSLALATNVAYSTGMDPATFRPTGTRRPRNYELTRDQPFEWLFAAAPNVVYSNQMIFDPARNLTNLVSYRYAAYSADINNQTNQVDINNTGVYEPENSLGRIEIEAGQLDLTQARIHAEEFLSIKTTNLIGNKLALVNAPVINYDLGSTNVVLPVSNLVASTFARLSGNISVWSATWETPVVELDFFGVPQTNMQTVHVMIVDDNLVAENPVHLNRFAARATNVVIYDRLLIDRELTVDADGLQLAASGTNVASLTLPPFADWAPTNFPRLRHFTNEGRVIIPQVGRFYTQYETNDANYYPLTLLTPYTDLINSGAITGAAHVVMASNLVNSGAWVAQSGALEFQLTNGLFSGGILNAKSDISFLAQNLTAVNSTFSAGGSLMLDVTNHLGDTGPAANNYWVVSDGFTLARRPWTGDLLGTRIDSLAAENTLVRHSWTAEDRGASPAGFSNNAAIGHLVLNGQNLSLFSFTGGGTNKTALYVDYLEFQNYATNVVNALQVETNLTIYFANANLSPDKLNGAFGGRLRWVPTYAGANSTTNLLVDGRWVAINTALIQSGNADLDGDGIPNRIDPTPLLSGASLNLKIDYVRAPGLTARISWDAIRYSTNHVEYRANLTAGNWLPLTTVIQGAANGRQTILDPVLPGAAPRYYRVRVEPYIGLLTP